MLLWLLAYLLSLLGPGLNTFLLLHLRPPLEALLLRLGAPLRLLKFGGSGPGALWLPGGDFLPLLLLGALGLKAPLLHLTLLLRLPLELGPGLPLLLGFLPGSL